MSVCLSVDGRYALSGSYDHTLRLWEVGTGRCLRTFAGHTDVVNSVCLSGDGRYALSGSKDNTLRLWELPSNFAALLLPLEPSRLTSATAAAAADRAYRQGMEHTRRALERGDAPAAASALRQARGQPGCRRRLEALELWTGLYCLLPHTSFAGGWLACVFKGHTEMVMSVCLSLDGRYALSGSDDHTLRLWEVGTGRCLRTFKGHAKVTSVCLSGDGRYALSGSQDMTLRLWEVGTARCLRTFEGHTKCVRSVCLSGDGRYALSGSDDTTLRLWELGTGRCLRTFRGHALLVSSVCLSGDGRYALSGSWDRTLRLWELGTGRCRRTFEGHTSSVYSVCLSGDGRYALSGSGDETLRLWELGTGRCLRTFEGHTSGVESACLSGDGRYALSGSIDKSLKLWVLDWELEGKLSTDWDEAARPYLEVFLTEQTPHAASLPAHRQPTYDELTLALTRHGQPTLTDADCQRVIYILGCAGFGWLRPEGVRHELEKMVAEWKGPPKIPCQDEAASLPDVASRVDARSFPSPERNAPTPLIGPALFVAGFGGATACFLSLSHGWLALSTGVVAFFALSILGNRLKAFADSAVAICEGFGLLLGFGVWTAYLVRNGFTWWALIPAAGTLFGLHGFVGGVKLLILNLRCTRLAARAILSPNDLSRIAEANSSSAKKDGK